jgi:hypothetical protein
MPSYSEDFVLGKKTTITEKLTLDFRADCFNLLNRHRFGVGNTNRNDPPRTDPNTGQIIGFGGNVGASGPRNIQLSMKLNF